MNKESDIVSFNYEDRFFEFGTGSLSFSTDGRAFSAYDKVAEPDFGFPPQPATGSSGVNFVTMNIAHDCNMACPYCFAKQGLYGGPRKLMTKETAVRIIDWMLEQSGDKEDCYLRFLGGEPLMNLPVMRESIEYSRKAAERHGKAMHFSVNTNGTIWNKQIEELLRQNDVTVSISIDGTKEAHNVHRIFRSGRGTYDTVVANVPRFLDIDPYTLVNGTLTADNLDIYDYVVAFRDLGFRAIRFAMVGTSEPGVSIHCDKMLEHIRKEYDRVARLYLSDISQGRIWYLADFYKYFDSLLNRKPRFNRCGAGTSYLNIDVDGNCHLCHRFTADKTQQVGSVDTGPIKVPDSIRRMYQLDPNMASVPSGTPAADGSEPIGKAMRAIHTRLDGSPMFTTNRPNGHVNTCSECDIRFLCGGSCFHDGEILFGDLHGGPDPFKCEVDRHLARVVMWLLDNLSTTCSSAIDDLADLHRRTIQHHK